MIGSVDVFAVDIEGTSIDGVADFLSKEIQRHMHKYINDGKTVNNVQVLPASSQAFSPVTGPVSDTNYLLIFSLGPTIS